MTARVLLLALAAMLVAGCSAPKDGVKVTRGRYEFSDDVRADTVTCDLISRWNGAAWSGDTLMLTFSSMARIRRLP